MSVSSRCSVASLNTTGEPEIIESKLSQQFEEDSTKFFRFVDRKIAEYSNDLSADYYKVETETILEGTLWMLEELIIRTNSINSMRRFIQGALGLVEDEEEKKLLERKPLLFELAKKYKILTKQFQLKSTEQALPESKDQEPQPPASTAEVHGETIQLQQYSLDASNESSEKSKETSKTVEAVSVEHAAEQTEKEYDIHLPMNCGVTSFNQTNDQTHDLNEDIDRQIDLEIEHGVRELNAAQSSAASAMSAASTPITRKNIRFSNIVDQHTISNNESGISAPRSVVNGRYIRSLSPNRSGRVGRGPLNPVNGEPYRPEDNDRETDSTQSSRRSAQSQSQVRSSQSQRRSGQERSIVAESSTVNSTVRVRSEDSWRFCEPISNNIAELSICEDLSDISKIIQLEVNEKLGDIEILSLESRELVELKQLKKDLESKCKTLPEECNQGLTDEAAKAFMAANRWISNLKFHIHSKELHLQSDLKFTKPIELEPFKGHSHSNTNCYEFFTSYELIARKYTDRDKAHFLFSNYLSDNIKCEVKHLNTSYRAMKECIIARHGNVNTLLMHKKNRIRSLKMIYYKSSRADKFAYVKKYMEICDQLCTLIELNTVEYPGIKHELLSYTSVMGLAKLLPDYIFNTFSSAYTKTKNRNGVFSLSGEEAFQILQSVLQQQLSELELREELFFDEDEKREPRNSNPRTTKKVLNIELEIEDLDHSVYSIQEGRRVFSTEKYFGFPCIGHEQPKYRVKDCEAGKCEDFLSMTPDARQRVAHERNLCSLCLLRACRIRQTSEGLCLFSKVLPRNVACKSCKSTGMDRNVLLCSEHKNDTPETQEAVRKFLPGCEDHTRIELLFLTSILNLEKDSVHTIKGVNRTCTDAFDINSGRRVPMKDIEFKTQKNHGSLAVYPTQTINIGGVPVTVLWDTGAIGELVKEEIAEKLNLTILDARSQKFSVAGGQTVSTDSPLYQLTFGPSDNDTFFQFPLLGVKKISERLPEVDLGPVITKVKKELVDFPESKSIFPERCGGAEIEMILGTRLSHIFPRRIYVLKDGLQIWRSPLRDIYGSNLLVSGPIEPIRSSANLVSVLHTVYQSILPSIESEMCLSSPVDCLTAKDGLEEDDLSVSDSDVVEISDHPSTLLLSTVDTIKQESDLKSSENALSVLTTIMRKKAIPRALEQVYKDEEEAGCIVDYRCSECYPCKQCLESERVRSKSIKEVAEESLIWKCVKIDTEKKITSCDYPFTVNPEDYLIRKWGGAKDNYKMAERTLNTQRAKSDESRASVVRFNSELRAKGFVSPVSELCEEYQKLIADAEFRHFFCWRSVQNQNSLTTSTRMVVDPTISHFNDVVAKGTNCLTSLYQLILCWRSYLYAFCSDISKMFNTLVLTPEMLKYSLYLFSESLDPLEDIQIWAFSSLMYGIKSSSNLATCGLKKTADLKKEECPLAHDVIYNKTYMDDSGAGANSKDKLNKIIEELLEVLPLGGFAIKIVTKSGEPPGEKASSDGITSSFGGYAWKTVEDTMLYKSSDLNFNVRRRGFKKPNEKPIVTKEDVKELVSSIKLTRRNLLGKVLEQFDLIGLFEPLKVRYKLSLHMLAGMDYDAAVDDKLREEWIENLVIMHLSRELECPRTVIPPDAEDPDNLELICCADAATSMCGCSIYLRVKLKTGGYSVRLLTARSKTTRLTIPRNELLGCMLASETAFIAAKALEGRVKSVIFVTDSAIALCWLNNLDLKLKQFVYARVAHTKRLIGEGTFYHVPGVLNPADLVTRGGCTLEDVKPGSVWQNGADWMYKDFSSMPIKSYADLCSELSQQDYDTVSKEVHPSVAGVNMFRHPVLNGLEGCFCIQDYDDDILNNAERICTGKCKILESDTSGLESACPGINIVRSEKSDLVSLDQNGMETSDLGNEIFSVQAKNKVEFPVDFVRLGFRKAFLILTYVQRYLTKLRHKAHQSKNQEFSEKCPLCKIKRKVSERQFTRLSEKFKRVHTRATCTPLDFHLSWKAVCRLGTLEVKEHYKSTPSKLKKYHEKDQILYGAGRLEYPDMRIELETPTEEIDFVKPVFLANSVVTYALALHVHWDASFCPHSGVSRTATFLAKMIHVVNVLRVIRMIREQCPKCRYLLKKHYLPLGTNQSIFSLMRAPPFFSMMADIAIGFRAYDGVRQRVTKECYFLVQVCMVTGATAIGVLESLTTNSIVMALTRTGNRYGWPKYTLFDCQSSFKTLENAKLSFKDLQGRLWTDQEMILDFSTPLAHQEHGRVEAKVKVLKEFLTRSGELGKKHTHVEWETIASSVSSYINGLPVCSNTDESTGAYGDLNLITPNLLLIGRNNARAPEGYVDFSTSPSKAIKNIAETNEKICELIGHFITRFIPGKKFSSARPPEEGDIVLCLMKESHRARNCIYKFGRIIQLCLDGRVNKVLVEYQNSTEVVKRKVARNIQSLVLILGVDEISFNSYEHFQATYAQSKFF